jgi:hypothetical protein
MDEKRLAGILNLCLEAIAAGETAEACVVRFPEYAAELRPLLTMAGELGTLGEHRVSDAARQRAKARLRRAAAARRVAPTSRGWLPGRVRIMPFARAALAVVLICALFTAGMVAASGPGGLTYGLRVSMERIPAQLAPSAEARARTELGIANRRLADLARTMRSQRQEVDQRTVSALLASIDAAAESAAGLPEAARAEIAALITEQAERLAQLERLAHSTREAGALEAATGRAYRAAERAAAGPGEPAPRPGVPAPGPTTRPSATPPSTLTVTRSPSPHASASPTASPSSAPSASPSPAATRTAARPLATPQARGTATPKREKIGATPTSPGPTPTSPGLGPEPTSPGPGPEPTSPGPGPEPTSPGPGPAPTSPGPGPAPTSPGPGPEPTSPGKGPGTAEPGPDQQSSHASGPSD